MIFFIKKHSDVMLRVARQESKKDKCHFTLEK